MAVASYMVSIYITIVFSGVYIAVFIIMIFFHEGECWYAGSYFSSCYFT
jgi:hypothetical protein